MNIFLFENNTGRACLYRDKNKDKTIKMFTKCRIKNQHHVYPFNICRYKITSFYLIAARIKKSNTR